MRLGFQKDRVLIELTDFESMLILPVLWAAPHPDRQADRQALDVSRRLARAIENVRDEKIRARFLSRALEEVKT
jgi:hypothetical protein